jgi:hypothetical protein
MHAPRHGIHHPQHLAISIQGLMRLAISIQGLMRLAMGGIANRKK